MISFHNSSNSKVTKAEGEKLAYCFTISFYAFRTPKYSFFEGMDQTKNAARESFQLTQYYSFISLYSVYIPLNLPLPCRVSIMNNFWLLLLKERIRLLFCNTHQFINDLLVLMIEVINMLLTLKMHGIASSSMNLCQNILLLHPFRTLIPNLIQSMEMSAIFQLFLNDV